MIALRPLLTPLLTPLVLGLVLVVGGCGSGEPATGDSATGVAADGDQHNAADVEFATAMIQHHAQALAMTDLTVGRTLDRPFVRLVDEIRAAQAPEIELMADWLQEWGEPVPETVRDHANAGHGGHNGHNGPDEPDEMPGMMSDEQLHLLEQASQTEFGDLWLTLMIEHHEGAVAMARAHQRQGAYGPAVELAEQIAASQTDEIAVMQELLAG